MIAYLAADGFVAELVTELGSVTGVHGRLVVTAGPRRPAAWAADVWLDPVIVPITSINTGVKALRAIHRYWAPYSFQLHRRVQLISEQLGWTPPVPSAFPATAPRLPVGRIWPARFRHFVPPANSPRVAQLIQAVAPLA